MQRPFIAARGIFLCLPSKPPVKLIVEVGIGSLPIGMFAISALEMKNRFPNNKQLALLFCDDTEVPSFRVEAVRFYYPATGWRRNQQIDQREDFVCGFGLANQRFIPLQLGLHSIGPLLIEDNPIYARCGIYHMAAIG